MRKGRHSLCWNWKWESGQWRRRSWGPLRSGLSPWKAAGECFSWLQERHWGIPSGQDCPSQTLLLSIPPRPYFCLPPRHHKPCVHVWSRWEDHSWSLQSTNCMRKVAERLVRARRVPTGGVRDTGAFGNLGL